MGDNNTIRILREAAECEKDVLTARAYSLEDVISLVEAAEKKCSPLIIQLLPWAVTSSEGSLVLAAAQAAKQASVLISVHLDHCQDLALVKTACELPFDSIMIDMSLYSQEDKLCHKTKLLLYCHSRGIATEVLMYHAEIGEGGVGSLINSIEISLGDEQYLCERVSLSI